MCELSRGDKAVAGVRRESEIANAPTDANKFFTQTPIDWPIVAQFGIVRETYLAKLPDIY